MYVKYEEEKKKKEWHTATKPFKIIERYADLMDAFYTIPK